MTTQNAIIIENLKKNFGSFTAVNDVTIGIRKGEILGLLGPNGAGKTTLIHSIMGIYKFEGKISVLGFNIPNNRKNARFKIGFMPQDFAIYLDLTPVQNAFFYGKIYGLKNDDIKNKIDSLFDLLALKEKANDLCRTLSGGQQRRVSLGIALLTDPDILILDEPTAGVDPILRKEFWDYFMKLRDQGKTILISTHIFDEALRTDRVALMMEGKLLALGNPKELMHEHNIETLEDLFIKYRMGEVAI